MADPPIRFLYTFLQGACFNCRRHLVNSWYDRIHDYRRNLRNGKFAVGAHPEDYEGGSRPRAEAAILRLDPCL